MADSKFAEMSCQVAPTGVTSFAASQETTDGTITASATADKNGSLVKGSWSHDDKQGTELSVSFPDGAVGGRNAPTKPEAAEGLRIDRGDLLMKKVNDCKKLANLSLF